MIRFLRIPDVLFAYHWRYAKSRLAMRSGGGGAVAARDEVAAGGAVCVPRLSRVGARARPPSPVRAVHLGLGAFHRAHQAWYTAADPECGIAAYSFRDPTLPQALTEQDGLFTLLIRGAGEPVAEWVGSISRAHPGTDTESWLADLAHSAVGVLTLTITEAGYQVGEGDTAVSRVLAGLRHRHRANGAPIALVPCDNVADNGLVLADALRRSACGLEPAFRRWLADDVAVISTVVDRITPATTDTDRELVSELTGFDDHAPVVAEPFSEWLLHGEFPHGRPAWERRGARFVDDLEPYQQRKLWFLNGAHTVLAYAGLAVGCVTVDEAVHHPEVSALIESWWNTAAQHARLPAQDLDAYREKLRSRFAAKGIRHRLSQIAVDGSRKIPLRLLPVLKAERAHSRLPEAVIATLAYWITGLRTAYPVDPDADALVTAARSADPVRGVLTRIDTELAGDAELIQAITSRAPSRQ